MGALVPPDPWMISKGFELAPRPAFGAPGKPCTIGPLVGSIIRFALTAGLFVGVSFGFGVVAIWLILSFISITRGWTGLLSRLLLGLFVSLIFAFIPYFGPMLSIGHLINPRCQPNEGGVGPCIMYGGDVGGVVHDTADMWSSVFIGAPLAFAAFGFYVLILLIAGVASRRRATRRREV